METSTKLALAIVGAALVLVVGYVAYQEFSRARNVYVLNQVVEGFNRSMAEDASEFRHAAAERKRRKRVAHARDLASRRLSPHQRCVGGTVIDINGNEYVQHLRDLKPV